MPRHDYSQSRRFTDEILPHEPRLRGWLEARFPSATDVDSIVRQAYIRLIDAHATGSLACARAFLFVTAHNLALAAARPRARSSFPTAAALDALATPDEEADLQDQLAQLNHDLHLLTLAVQSLPARARHIVTLRKVYGLSPAEISARLAIPLSAVETGGAGALRRCLEFLRENDDEHPWPSWLAEKGPRIPRIQFPMSQASRWLWRCDRGLSGGEQDEFMQWLATDPRHRECLALLRRAWQELDRLAGALVGNSRAIDLEVLAPAFAVPAYLRLTAPLFFVWLAIVIVAGLASG